MRKPLVFLAAVMVTGAVCMVVLDDPGDPAGPSPGPTGAPGDRAARNASRGGAGARQRVQASSAPVGASARKAARRVSRVTIGDPAGGKGTVVVDPIPIGEVWKGNDTGATEQSVFTVRIDDLDAVRVSTHAAGNFTGLALDRRHLVDIHLDGRRLTSFWFTFDDRTGPHRRLWYKTKYGAWSLWSTRRTGG